MTNIFQGVGHALASLTTNCSAFGKAWESAKEGENRWRGEWRSEVNGHHGALRCVLARIDNKTLSADFHARYSKFLRVCYSVQLTVKQSGEVLRLEGESDLGSLAGGIYR